MGTAEAVRRARVNDTMVPVDRAERDALRGASLTLTGSWEWLGVFLRDLVARWDAQQAIPGVLDVGTHRLPVELEGAPRFEDQLA